MKKAFILFLFVSFFSDAISQDVSKDTASRVSSLDEVIISAHRNEETRRTVAQQIQLLDSKRIIAAQAQTTADLLSNTAGVFVQRSQMGGGSPVLRGFEANRVLLVVDGVRLNNLIYRGGHLQNILTIDNNSLERIEVLYGPASTMYGSDALGGVIHMYTRAPHFSESDGKTQMKLNAFTRFGTVNDENTAHVDFNLSRKKVATYTSLTASNFGDLRGGTNQNPFYTGPYGERPNYIARINEVDSIVKNSDRYLQVSSGFSQFDLVQKISFRPGNNGTHNLNVQFSTSGDVPRYDRLTDKSGAELKYAEWYYGPQKRLLAAYDFQADLRGRFFQKCYAGVNFQSIEESRHQRRYRQDWLQHRTENVKIGGLQIGLKHISNEHVLHLGVDAQYNTLHSTAFQENINTAQQLALDTRYPDGGSQMSSVAAFVSHTWKINSQLTLTDGFRIGYSSLQSKFKDTTFFKFPFSQVNQQTPVYSGSIGLIHIPNDDLKLSAQLSTGFRVPNVDDLAKVFETTSGNVIVPNEDLKPEKTISTELGITKIYNTTTSWENVFYYTQLTDAIVTDVFKYNGSDSIVYNGVNSRVLASQNKRSAYIYGFSSVFRTILLENLRMKVAMNYTYGRYKTDSSDVPMDHIPPFQIRLGLEYAHGNFATDFFANYNGWKRLKDYYLKGEDNEQYATPEGMPAWFTLNWRVAYKLTGNISLQAGIDNILDVQYRTFASGINAPGRNCFITVKYNL